MSISEYNTIDRAKKSNQINYPINNIHCRNLCVTKANPNVKKRAQCIHSHMNGGHPASIIY